ncbi:MAG: 16S rRNA (cytosine(1402)-N(4))-methyltransferase RsmH [Thermodesulfobacteriota bacterium]
MIHQPVMVHEVIHFLRCAEGGIFVDGTLGTGGHTLAIFKHSPATTQVIGIDRDPEALNTARHRLKPFSERLRLVKGKFGEIRDILSGLGVRAVDGFLLDLGFSSLQIEGPGRGFSFQREEALDMRMDQNQGEKAGEWLGRVEEKELAAVLKEFGEERQARQLARRIKASQAKKPFQTTLELANMIASVVPRAGRIHPATRTFQALRIVINDELEQLKQFLDQFLDLLSEGGRVCLISYHSLEDRLIKQSFLRLERGVADPLGLKNPWKPEGQPGFKRCITKAVQPTKEEVLQNPRARGAKLRVGIRMEGLI